MSRSNAAGIGSRRVQRAKVRYDRGGAGLMPDDDRRRGERVVADKLVLAGTQNGRPDVVQRLASWSMGSIPGRNAKALITYSTRGLSSSG